MTELAATFLTIWLFIGSQILVLSIYILIRSRRPFRIPIRAVFGVIVFWPDYIAGVIHHHRTKRKTQTQ